VDAGPLLTMTLSKLAMDVSCLFEEISGKTVKTITRHSWNRIGFVNIFVWGITPDYSTNGGRVIDTLYLEEKGKK